MLVEELENGLVSTLVLLPHLGILQVRSRSHPAMDLTREGLDMLGDLQICLIVLDILSRLISRGEHRHGDIHSLGVIGIDHSRVALRSGLEELIISARSKGSDLAAPAETQDRPGLEVAARGQLVTLGYDVGDLGKGVGWGGLGRKEVAQLLLVLIGGRRVPRDVGRATLEEVGHEHAVLLVSRSCKDIGTLDGLVEKAKDICRSYNRVSPSSGWFCGEGTDHIRPGLPSMLTPDR